MKVFLTRLGFSSKFIGGRPHPARPPEPQRSGVGPRVLEGSRRHQVRGRNHNDIVRHSWWRASRGHTTAPSRAAAGVTRRATTTSCSRRRRRANRQGEHQGRLRPGARRGGRGQAYVIRSPSCPTGACTDSSSVARAGPGDRAMWPRAASDDPGLRSRGACDGRHRPRPRTSPGWRELDLALFDEVPPAPWVHLSALLHLGSTTWRTEAEYGGPPEDQIVLKIGDRPACGPRDPDPPPGRRYDPAKRPTTHLQTKLPLRHPELPHRRAPGANIRSCWAGPPCPGHGHRAHIDALGWAVDSLCCAVVADSSTRR